MPDIFVANTISDLLDLLLSIQLPKIVSVSPVVSAFKGHVGYISAVSKKLMPASMDISICSCPSFSEVASPNVIVPRQYDETSRSEFPNFLNCI